MMRQIVRRIVAQTPDLEIAGELQDVVDMIERSPQASDRSHDQPEVVILGLDRDATESASRVPDAARIVLERLPRAKVFGLSSDGRRGFLYELSPRMVSLGELSANELVNAIRSVGEER
jgi:hypothetical protein